MGNEMIRYADEDEIVVPSGTKILDRIGTPEERKFLIAVMAEQLGIPASESARPDVLAVIANAAQRTIQFGWQPGVHMHVQPFNGTEEGPKGQEVKVKKWVLVDGEKAWKDSAERHRRNGVQFTIITRPQEMTSAEINREAIAMGMKPGDLAVNAYGVYAKVVVRDEFEINCLIYGKEEAFAAIPWASGVYTGKKRNGRWWNDDNLPTGATPRDVAIRRAHKRALMQSTLPLIPLDDKTEADRLGEFTANVRQEELHRHRRLQIPAPRPPLDAFDEEILDGCAPSANCVIDSTTGEIIEKRVQSSQSHATNGHSQPKAPVEPPPSVESLDDVSESPVGADVGPTELEVQAAAIIAEHKLTAPPKTQAWAVQAGYCANEHEARNSWKKIVDSSFGGKMDLVTMPKVIQAYVVHQLEKKVEPVAA
jgi:hypothetical protein